MSEYTDLRTYEARRWLMETGLAAMRPVDPDGPRTLEPTFAQYMAYCADGALAEWVNWQALRLWPRELHELAALAGAEMARHPERGRMLGLRVQAGRTAYRDMAAEDVTEMVHEARRAVSAALHSRIASVTALVEECV